MAFTKLSAQEKQAFFGLLDEYFQSRPEIFQAASGHGGDQEGAGPVISTAAAASIAQRAIAASSHLNASGASAGGAGGVSKSNNPYVANMASNTELHNAVGRRVAAASLAFSNNNSQTQTQTSKSDPPSLPNRITNAPIPPPSRASQEHIATPGMEVDKLITKKGSVFGAFKKPPPAGTVIPPAFAAPKSSFGPPPVRRTTSDASSATNSGTTSPMPSLPRRQVAPQPESEEPQGEWAEVLYDYRSEDPGDLTIEVGTRVLVTAKSSDDWWTGQIEGQGKEGLFPASYVKLS